MEFILIHLLLCARCILALENLALGRPAWQLNNYPGKPLEWGATKAVDGLYSNRSAAGNQCTLSAYGKQTATWGVDLQSVVSISYVKIYYRTDNFPSPGAYFDRFAGFFVYVSNSTSKDDGKLCYHELQAVNGTPTEDQRINCSMYGRYVIYYNERRRSNIAYPNYYSQYAWNELCELEVYGCPVPGYYGENCNQSCPENCQGQQCDAVAGNCVNGCLQGYQGPHCSYFNLALGKPAWQQHNWPDKSVAWGAKKAVDGKYSDRRASGGQCTISGPDQRTAEWRVDLLRVLSISHINIYYRTDNSPSPGIYYKRFAGFFVYVSNDTSKENGSLCFHEIQIVDGTPVENQTISCPYDGRYVIYYNERKANAAYPAYYSPFAHNELCEFEVYGCPDSRYYGKYCKQSCPDNCLEGRCNIYTGNCLGCIPGYKGPRCDQKCDGGMYGDKCNERCGHCLDYTQCHHINGTCSEGCSVGYEGPLCIKQCIDGKYGLKCNQICGHCSDGSQCHHINGTCLNGCSAGYKGPLCRNECDGGMYGATCSQKCGHCLDNTQFHHINGTCSEGCSAGYEGPLCIKQCDGRKYGLKCNQSCGHCSDGSQCHHINGTCLDGCSPGYKGPLCINECDGGMYGAACSQKCAHCLDNTQCHHINGICSEGCSVGYEGSLCIKQCPDGYYGQNCLENCMAYCGRNKTCDSITGVCYGGCREGLYGPLCNEDSFRDLATCKCENCNTSIIISVVISVLCVLMGSIVTLIMWKRKQAHIAMKSKHKRSTDSQKAEEKPRSSKEDTSHYAELGVLDNPSTYEELHQYTEAIDRNNIPT